LIPLLLTLAIFPLVGGAAARLLRIALPPTRMSRLAFAFLLGLGAQGTFLYLLGALRVPLSWPVYVVPAVIAIAVRGWRFAFDGTSEQRFALSSIVFAIPLVVMLFAGAILPTRDYDGRVTWLPKARAIALESSISGPFFHGQRGLNLHNRYPLLIPLDVATVMKLSGDTRNETGRWIYIFIAISMLIVLRAFLRKWFEASGGWISAGVAWLPLLTTIEGGALAAYNDFALAAFLGIAALSLLDNEPRAAGVFAAFAVMTKNEGLALATAIVIAAIVVRRLRVSMLVPIAMAEAIVVYCRRMVPAAYDEQYEVLISSLPDTIARMPEATRAIVRHAIDFDAWGGFWIAAAIAAVICAIRVRDKRLAILLVTIVAALGAFVAALTVTSWSIADLAPVAVNRLLAQLLVPATTLIAMATHALGRR
jgi:hypothetical protein